MLSTHRPFLARGLALPRALRADLALTVFSSLLIALSAQIAVRVPFSPVPITAQTFTILLLAHALGRRRAVHSVLLYLAEGAAGLPVFAGGGAGLAWLLGPTGGYLLGFAAAALLVGALSDRGYASRRGALVAFASGHLVIYLLGAAWLSTYSGWETALQTGILPFLSGDVIKVILGAVSISAVRRLPGSGVNHN